MYYGTAGIGKSSINQQLYKIHTTNRDDLVMKLDFSIPEHREKSHALSILKHQLVSKYKVKMPTFELAFMYYWSKTKPDSPLLQKAIPYIEDVDLTTSLLQSFFAFDDKTMKLLTESIVDISGGLPFIKEFITTLKGGSKVKAVVDTTKTKRKHKALSELITKDPAVIAEYLPYYFSNDINEYLRDNPSKRCYILLDTYEELWNGSRDWGSYNLKDSWIRDLIKQTPLVQWIITGRDPLKWKDEDSYWNSYLIMRDIDAFDRNEGLEYLTKSSVEPAEIREKIYAQNQLPEHLRLSALKYYDIKFLKDRSPTVEDFNTLPEPLFKRIQNHLQKAEKQTLYALSPTRHWDREIFEYITKEFNTGLNTFDFQDYLTFSFIKQRYNDNEEEWEIEKNVRKASNEFLRTKDSYVWNKLQESYFHFYQKKFKQDVTNLDQIERIRKTTYEYMYHAKAFLDSDQLLQWFFDEIKDPVIDVGDLDLAVTIFEELVETLQKVPPTEKLDLLVTARENLGELYEQVGNPKLAESLYRSSLEVVTNTVDKIIIQTNLALLLKSTFVRRARLQESKQLLQWNLEKLGTIEQVRNDNLLKVYIRNKEHLADLLFNHDRSEEKEKAITYLIEILDLKDELGTFSEISKDATYTLLGDWYLARDQFSEARNSYEVALRKLADDKSEEGQEKTSYLFNNIGVSWAAQGNFDVARDFFNKSIKITNDLHPTDSIYSAKAKLNLGCLHRDEKKYQDAISIFEGILESVDNNDEIYQATMQHYKKTLLLFQTHLMKHNKGLKNRRLKEVEDKIRKFRRDKGTGLLSR